MRTNIKEEEPIANGVTMFGLRSVIENVPHEDLPAAFKVLSKMIFSEDELIGSSISGKRSVKSGSEIWPPLDAKKVNIMKTVIKGRYPKINHKAFIEKLQNVQKVLWRQKAAKSHLID